VKYSPALKWFLLLLLPLTLGWKSALRLDYSNDFPEKVTEFLVRNHFTVVVTEEVIRQRKTFRASKGACRMLVTETSYRGGERDMINGRATAADNVFIVFGGKIYAEQPTWLTASNFLWYKLLSELGFKVHFIPVIAVIATRNCDAELLPWYEISSAGSSWY
jgi:hypothetical protein